MITLYGFKRVRDFVVGETRDLRALWALEETDLAYEVHGLDFIRGDTQTDSYRQISPFNQVPVIDDDGFILAETGAILNYIAEKAGKLIPTDLRSSARHSMVLHCAEQFRTYVAPNPDNRWGRRKGDG